MTATRLPAIDVTHREQRARDALAASEADALVVTSHSNIRWLTGFAGSNGLVLLHDDALVLLTDSRYADRAPDEIARVKSTATVVVESRDLGDKVATALQGLATVGLEADNVTWARQRTIATEWLPGSEVIATNGVLDGLRSVKDDAEIARIERAAGIVDKALAAVAPRLQERPTERQFAAALDAAIRAGGADDLGFDTIVASGPNGAIPHHHPGDRTIAEGDLVIVDVGAQIDGYRSDMTRTFCVGAMTDDQRHHYDTVIAAQQAGVLAMRAGAQTSDVDAAARDLIGSAGWADCFEHGTGHGVGLDIHELPRVAAGANDRYDVGTVATVEPGVYLRGVGGVRIEDTCVATADGAIRLTRFPKDQPVVG